MGDVTVCRPWMCLFGAGFLSVFALRFTYLLRIGRVDEDELGTLVGIALGSGSFGEENLSRVLAWVLFCGSGSRLMSVRRLLRHFTGICDGSNQQNWIYTVLNQQKLGEMTKNMGSRP